MFKHYFDQVSNIAIWPIISLVIFVTFFVGLLIWVAVADKKYISDMSHLPLDDAAENNKKEFDYV